MSQAPSSPKVGFVSLGCPKALVDSERIITQMRSEGYQISNSYDDANLVVVNTCGFIDSAIEESMDAIGEAMHENGRVIVTGCLGKESESITRKYPEVLAVTGAHAYEEVMTALHEHCPAPHDPLVDLVPPQGIKLTPKHYAYLKISEGCNHRCSFCIIPSLRGDLVSRPIGDVLSEAKNLADAGVKELLVVSQDTSAYGVDVKYQTGFWNGRPVKSNLQSLAEALAELGIWVRMHYVYPYPHVDKLIPLMASGDASGCILPYLDIPMQHASPRILKSMKRPAKSARMLERIQAWREICPDLTVRSTFIVGFPGETEEDFEELLEFLQQARINRLGCFTYSAVDGATANDLPDSVPEDVKQHRFDTLMQLQAQISTDLLQDKVGSTQTILVDEHIDGHSIARSSADAPEIDGNVIVHDTLLPIGEFSEVKISAATEYDLIAIPTNAAS